MINMAYETSYDVGLKPFNHDKNRGKWSSPSDFLFACLGHGFKIDAIIILPTIMFADLRIYALIPYLIILAVCVVPIVFMQSFLGQFSSTGFISAFRLSPIFKGIGYVSLAINLLSLTYYAVLGAIPLFYFLHTLTPLIPWSCEGSESWMALKENSTSVCDYNSETHTEFTEFEVPSVEFFDRELNTMGTHHTKHPEGTFSWFLMICTFTIWSMVAIIVVKPTESIGRFLRVSCITVLGIMGVLLIRFSFLPKAFDEFKFFFTSGVSVTDSLVMMPLIAFSALGPGWGTVLTMASFNKFDTNIFRYSWLLCLAQVGILMGMAFISIFMAAFMTHMDQENIGFKFVHSQWMEFLVIPTALTEIELGHLWSWLFFGMIFLGCMNLVIVQLFSVLTSLFDEFEILRASKKEVKLATVGMMALASIFFCSNYGITCFETLMQLSVLSQIILNFLLLIVVVWFYGRERFQRDVSFMTNRTYPTWMVNVVRYVAPIIMFSAWLVAFAAINIYLRQMGMRSLMSNIITIAIMPCLFIPGYCIYKIFQTRGVLGTRFRRCIRPTDWYPSDPVDRERYEERFCETDISHNLFTQAVEENLS